MKNITVLIRGYSDSETPNNPTHEVVTNLDKSIKKMREIVRNEIDKGYISFEKICFFNVYNAKNNEFIFSFYHNHIGIIAEKYKHLNIENLE